MLAQHPKSTARLSVVTLSGHQALCCSRSEGSPYSPGVCAPVRTDDTGIKKAGGRSAQGRGELGSLCSEVRAGHSELLEQCGLGKEAGHR